MALLGSGPVISAAIAPYIPGSNVLKPAHTQIPALPSYFPTRLDAELAWTHADFPNESSYIYKLTGTDLEEINKGLIHFKGESCPC